METNLNQYLEIFLEESNEHLQSINDHLLNLEKEPENLQIMGEIFRSAHTLKGMAATMGYGDIADLTHKMENVFDLIRNEKCRVTSELIDVLFKSVESLEEMVALIREGGEGKKDVSELVESLHRIENNEAVQPIKEQNNPVSKVSMGDLSVYEKNVVAEAERQGFETHHISINLDEDCLLKSVRVYLVFQALEQFGEVIKTIPDIESLENEQFESEFHVLLLSKFPGSEIKEQLLTISEVKQVELSTYSRSENGTDPEPKQNKNEKTPVEPTVKPKAPVPSNSSAAPKTIRVNIEKIDQLMNLFEELIIDRGRLEDISNKMVDPQLNETVEKMVRVSSDLQSLILQIRMVPVEQVFNRFPRMVRGLAKDLDKQINLEIIGADTELDRTVIDEIGDPLVHLIRNSLDHGIEKPEIRIQNGKNPEGNVTLRAYNSGNHVFIEIEDDGAGINRDKVLKKAIENHVIKAEGSDQLTDEQIYQFIFSSGFSTADQISDISGRGVGLDVVKNKIELLGGSISIESKQGKGTLFSIKLPLTLSIISAMLVKVGEEIYAVPLSSIIETASISSKKIMKAHGQDVIDFRDKVVPLVDLKKVLNVPSLEEENKTQFSILIIKKDKRLAALAVDSFIGQKEIVLKSLGDYIKNIFAISGATILGDGNIALILDPNDLIK